MNKLLELTELLVTDEHIIRFKQLEKIIDHNEILKADYNNLLDLQKLMVQNETKKSPNYNDSKINYDAQKEKIMSNFILEEYLDLIELINNDLQMIKNIIEREINIDFD